MGASFGGLRAFGLRMGVLQYGGRLPDDLFRQAAASRASRIKRRIDGLTDGFHMLATPAAIGIGGHWQHFPAVGLLFG